MKYRECVCAGYFVALIASVVAVQSICARSFGDAPVKNISGIMGEIQSARNSAGAASEITAQFNHLQGKVAQVLREEGSIQEKSLIVASFLDGLDHAKGKAVGEEQQHLEKIGLWAKAALESLARPDATVANAWALWDEGRRAEAIEMIMLVTENPSFQADESRIGLGYMLTGAYRFDEAETILRPLSEGHRDMCERAQLLRIHNALQCARLERADEFLREFLAKTENESYMQGAKTLQKSIGRITSLLKPQAHIP